MCGKNVLIDDWVIEILSYFVAYIYRMGNIHTVLKISFFKLACYLKHWSFYIFSAIIFDIYRIRPNYRPCPHYRLPLAFYFIFTYYRRLDDLFLEFLPYFHLLSPTWRSFSTSERQQIYVSAPGAYYVEYGILRVSQLKVKKCLDFGWDFCFIHYSLQQKIHFTSRLFSHFKPIQWCFSRNAL